MIVRLAGARNGVGTWKTRGQTPGFWSWARLSGIGEGGGFRAEYAEGTQRNAESERGGGIVGWTDVWHECHSCNAKQSKGIVTPGSDFDTSLF